MKKVYCLIENYMKYNEQVLEIYETEQDAIECFTRRVEQYECDSIMDFVKEYGITLVEWECGLQNKRLIKYEREEKMNKVKLECCKECPTWWHESDELEEGGWCMYDEERIKCVWSESEIEREEN